MVEGGLIGRGERPSPRARPFHLSLLLRALHDDRRGLLLGWLLAGTRSQERSRDQEQTQDTAQLGHGETPFCFAPRESEFIAELEAELPWGR
jgi:hypothetical protein